jgi:hypothetical protein
VISSIADLPFRERPLIELLHLDEDRDEPSRDYAGYGWARAPRIYLDDGSTRAVDNALVLAIHAADDAEPLAGDIDLAFELADGPGFRVRLSKFLDVWLPKLPHADHVVLVACNPHRTRLGALLTSTFYYGLGDVASWLDPHDRTAHVRLTAETWCTLPPVSTELIKRPGTTIDDDKKHTYASIYLLKKMDLKPEDGGMEFPVVLPSELSPIDETLQQLAVDDMLVIHKKKPIWDLTKKGIQYLADIIDETTDMIDEFDDLEVDEAIEELRARKLDVYRARFLWGWYEGEFDDLVLWQERRGVSPVERLWAFYLMSDEFWNELGKDLEDQK